MKDMNLKEFRDQGYLQEANRLFFHPLGLMLSMTTSINGKSTMSVLDDRADPEGSQFDFKSVSAKENFQDRIKRDFIASEFRKRKEVREKLFGDAIEPIPLILKNPNRNKR